MTSRTRREGSPRHRLAHGGPSSKPGFEFAVQIGPRFVNPVPFSARLADPPTDRGSAWWKFGCPSLWVGGENWVAAVQTSPSRPNIFVRDLGVADDQGGATRAGRPKQDKRDVDPSTNPFMAIWAVVLNHHPSTSVPPERGTKALTSASVYAGSTSIRRGAFPGS
jgi:hypothetical protein